MPKTETELYLDRARQDLRAAQSNLEQGFYGVTVTRAYYAMFYAASALLSNQGISRSRHSGVKTMHNNSIHLADKEQRAAAELVVRLCQRFDGQLVSAILFGSRARGDAGPHSDLDVAIVLSDVDPDIRKEVRHLAVEVWLEHGIYISTRVWDRTHWRKLEELRTTFYQNIRRDGVDLLELSPAATP